MKLSTQLSAGFALIVLVTVTLVSVVANILINHQFERYVEEQQKEFSEGLADGLSDQYDANKREWNTDYIHGFGMYALNDGYIIKLYDTDENTVWDAENHDMTLCHQIMGDIRLRMQEQRPGMKGDFVTNRYELKQDEVLVGYADISYYSPYYFNEDAFQFVKSLNGILFAVGVVSLLGAVVAGIILAKYISGPVVSATKLTGEISDGNYDVRVHSEVKTKELSELTRAVNHMAEMLEKQETMRKRLTTDVAHELRTPLANVTSNLEAIIEGVWEPSAERLQNCYDELGRISGIVSDLERLRQIEDEKLQLKIEPVDLMELSESVRAAFEPELARKELTCTVEGCGVIVPGDRRRLHQVIFNLLSNAVKYSAEKGEIRIVTADSGTDGVVIVEDHGIGIPKEDIPFIFERFYRTDKSRYRKTGGAGIGLTIVKAVIEKHGGTVRVESEEERGSRFIVTLPKKYDPQRGKDSGCPGTENHGYK